MTNIRVKQYGAYRSGTNVLRAWLLEALGVDILAGGCGHKHDGVFLQYFPNQTIAGWKFLISIRNPYAWLGGWAHFNGINPNEVPPEFANMSCIYWHNVYRQWLRELPQEQTYVVTHEMLIRQPDTLLDEISEFLGVPVTGPRDIPARRITPDMGVSEIPFDGRALLSGEFMSHINPAAIAVMTEKIHWDWIKAYGYKPVGECT